MVFHESLNPERKFSLAIPLVFIAILGGTTGVVSVATVLSPDASYAVNARSQLAQGAAPAGSDKSECTADSPTGQIDPATKKIKKVGKYCKPNATKGETGVTVDDGCKADDAIDAGKCLVIYCSPGGVCVHIEQSSEPKNLPQSTQQLFQMARNVQTAPEGGAELVNILSPDPETPGGTLIQAPSDETMSRLERAYSNDFDASIPDPNKGGISALDEIKRFGGGDPAFTGDGDGGNGARPLNPSTAGDVSWLSPTPFGGTPEAGFSQEGPGLNNPILSGNTFQGGVPSDADITKATEEGFKGALPVANDGWANDFNYQTAGGDALDPSVAKMAEDARDWPSAADSQMAKDAGINDIGKKFSPGGVSEDWTKDFNYETAGANPEPGSSLPKEGEQIPLPRPAVRDLSGSLDVDVSKLPQGVNMKIGDGILVTNDGKKIEVTDVASGKTETYFVSETKGAKLADLVQDTQIANGPFAQEADNLRKAADSVAKTDPERAAGLRREADKIDPRIPASGPAQKAPADPNGNPSGPGKTGAGDSTKNNSGSGSGIGSALSSMLQGLMKALGAPQPPPSAPSQPCSTDPNIYAQQQQQYQQQLQQYNYQLQQQQYQQQVNQFYAERTGTTPPPAQPLPPQPSACTPSSGSQCKAQPQQPPASACSAGSWRATYSGACVTGWQCISTQGPKAELACEPDIADVGSTLAITYGCSSGVASSSSFQVTTQPGGSATTTVKAPPAGTNTATYTLACTDNGPSTGSGQAKTTGAQCSVKVNRANIILVANPKTVPANGTSLISWLTTGMDSCVISSPDQADFTARNSSNTSPTGAATTSPIASGAARFQLDCVTTTGIDKQATTSVSIAP